MVYYPYTGSVYTTQFSWQKQMFAHCLGLLFTHKWWKHILKMETFESGHKSGDHENGVKRKRWVNSKNGDLSEYNGHCHTKLKWLLRVQKWIQTVSLFLGDFFGSVQSVRHSILVETREDKVTVGTISGFYCQIVMRRPLHHPQRPRHYWVKPRRTCSWWDNFLTDVVPPEKMEKVLVCHVPVSSCFAKTKATNWTSGYYNEATSQCSNAGCVTIVYITYLMKVT